MRSRYSAYATGDLSYVKRTWAPETVPPDLDQMQPVTWLGLTVKKARMTDPTHGTVEFVARGRQGGAGAFRLHENSRFESRDGFWLYVDGDLFDK